MMMMVEIERVGKGKHCIALNWEDTKGKIVSFNTVVNKNTFENNSKKNLIITFLKQNISQKYFILKTLSSFTYKLS